MAGKLRAHFNVSTLDGCSVSSYCSEQIDLVTSLQWFDNLHNHIICTATKRIEINDSTIITWERATRNQWLTDNGSQHFINLIADFPILIPKVQTQVQKNSQKFGY